MASSSTVATGSASSRALSAFHYRNFRLYFGGQLVSMSGTWMQNVAQGWLVFSLTHSDLWLGIVACAAGLPSLLISPISGVFVERLPRHKILLATQTAQMLLAFTLAALTFSGLVQVWQVVLLAFILGITNAIDAPARQALVVDLVGKRDLESGISLSAMMFNTSRVFGPAAAGIALVAIGPAWCFFINGLTFLAVIVSLLLMRIEAQPKRVSGFSPYTQLKEGLHFSRHHATILPLLLLAVVGAVFTMNISTLLPAFADDVLHSPTDGYAALSVANGVGAVIAAILVTYLGMRFGRGHVVMSMAIASALITAVFSQSPTLPLALFLTTLAGFSLILQFVTMNTLLQSEVPDEFRGRVMSLYTLTFFGMAPFAALALGALAEQIGTGTAILLAASAGGLLNVLIIARSPRMRALA